MKIYTRAGDKGTTTLIGGARVPKTALQIDAYGTVDELNAHMGLLRDYATQSIFKEEIIFIQDRLFTIGSWLAADHHASRINLPRMREKDFERLELSIDRMEEELEPLNAFVFPGGHPTVSLCHISRCVCRRAERLVAALTHPYIENRPIVPFLNRLSDYLFVYGRYTASKLGIEEITWSPEKRHV